MKHFLLGCASVMSFVLVVAGAVGIVLGIASGFQGHYGVSDVKVRTFKIIKEESCVGGGYKARGNCTYRIVEPANGQESFHRTQDSFAPGQTLYFVEWINVFGIRNYTWKETPTGGYGR